MLWEEGKGKNCKKTTARQFTKKNFPQCEKGNSGVLELTCKNQKNGNLGEKGDKKQGGKPRKVTKREGGK